MKIELRNARFTEDGVEVEINGAVCSVDSKWSVLREGLCMVRGPETVADALNTVPHPDDDELRFCGHWPLVELAARFWRLSNSENEADWSPGPVEVITDPPSARDAWLQHVQAVEESENA